MASNGYSESYRAARVKTLEAQIEAHRANIVALESERDRYTTNPFKGNAKPATRSRAKATADD